MGEILFITHSSLLQGLLVAVLYCFLNQEVGTVSHRLPQLRTVSQRLCCINCVYCPIICQLEVKGVEFYTFPSVLDVKVGPRLEGSTRQRNSLHAFFNLSFCKSLSKKPNKWFQPGAKMVFTSNYPKQDLFKFIFDF